VRGVPTVTELLPFVVLGLASGAVYGLAGAGLVLTFKTSGVFNFAHGAVAAAAAYVFYELWVQRGLPWPLAAIVCLGVVAPLAGFGLERLARGLADVGPAQRIVATVGLLLVIEGLATAWYGPEAHYFPAFLPTTAIAVSGIRIGIDQLLVAGIAAAGSLGLALYFRVSRTGSAMRAVVDDPALLDLAGTDPSRVRQLSWIIGAVFAALSGILLAPTIGLEAVLLTFLVVQAFGAAAIGRFSSLPLTFVGGLVIGVGAALATQFLGGIPGLNGLPASLPFLVLFAVLLMSPRGWFTEKGRHLALAVSHVHLPDKWRRNLMIIAYAVVLALPLLVGARLPVFTSAAIFVVLFCSMVLLVNMSGQVSLCHAAFAAVGAATFSHLAVGAGLPWLVALLGAGLVTMGLGVIVAIPAIRLSGLYLALATFGFGILMERMVYGTALMFGATGTRTTPRPGVLGLSGDVGFYYLAVAFAVVVGLLTIALREARIGRLCSGLADSPTALSTMGADVTVTRLLVFCLSAFIAGVAGGLLGALNGSASGVGFTPMHSLIWLAVLATGGVGLVKPAILAAIALAVLPAYLRPLADYLPVLFGVVAIIAALGVNGRWRIDERLSNLGDDSLWRVVRSPVRERRDVAAEGAT
jgi:branched-subunit amino acid ABC-type transport system permease component